MYFSGLGLVSAGLGIWRKVESTKFFAPDEQQKLYPKKFEQYLELLFQLEIIKFEVYFSGLGLVSAGLGIWRKVELTKFFCPLDQHLLYPKKFEQCL